MGKFCISVLQMSESTRSGPVSAGEKNTETINKENDEVKAKKWGQELLAKVFTQAATKRSAEEAIQKESANLNIQGKNTRKGTPYGIIIEEYGLFMRDIFDEKGNYKQTAAQGIRALSKAIGIDGVTNTENARRTTEIAKKFKEENPIGTYSENIIRYCMEHPQQAASGINIEKSGYNLKKELKKVTEAGGDELKEYKTFLESVIHIVGTDEFDKYTGKYDTRKISKEELITYQKAFKDTLLISIQTRTTQKPNTILERYKAQQEQLRKEALEYEKRIRSEINSEALGKIFETGNSRQDIAKKIEQIEMKYLGTHLPDYNKYAYLILPRIGDVLGLISTAKSAATDTVLDGNTLGGRWRGTTKDAYLKAVRDALKESELKKENIPVVYSSEKGGYSGIKPEELFQDPEKINTNAWKIMMKTTYWESTLQNQGREKLWAIGEYIKNNPKTRLIQISDPPGRGGQIKDFLEQKNKEHITDKIEAQQKTEYSTKLYNKLKDNLQGMILERFIEIGKDGTISGQELYSHIKFDNPNGYIDFEKKFQDATKILDGEFNKIIAESSKENTYKTITDISKEVQKKYPNIDIARELALLGEQKVENLSPKQSKDLLRLILTKYPNSINKDTPLFILLSGKINRDLNNITNGSSRIRTVAVTEGGMSAVNGIKEGKLKTLEGAGGSAYAAKQEANYQIESIRKDTDIVGVLEKYGYTIKMLENPVHVQNLYKKIVAMPDGKEKETLIAYIQNLKSAQESQLRSYARVIEEVGESRATGYISTISGKRETTESIQAYKFMNENIIENVEYPKSPVAYEIAQMNIDEKKNLSKITDGANSFASSYEIVLSAPNSYIIQGTDGKELVQGLNAGEAEEFIADMAVLDMVGLNDLFPYIDSLKGILRRGKNASTAIDGKKSNTEQRILLTELYDTIFGERPNTTNLYDVVRAFQSHILGASNKITAMRPYLKDIGLLREDSTVVGYDAMKSVIT